MNPRTVLITGATKGLGLEFVKQFAKRKEPPKLILAACLDPNNAKVLTFIIMNDRSFILPQDMTGLSQVNGPAAVRYFWDDRVGSIIQTVSYNCSHAHSKHCFFVGFYLHLVRQSPINV